MITVNISRQYALTQLKPIDKQYLISLGLEIIESPYNELCDYVSQIKIKESLSYQLEEKLHQAYCDCHSKYYFDAQRILSLLKMKLNKLLVEKSSEFSGHEVTSLSHIITNPGGKCFSRPMSKWGNSIYQSNVTYQQLVDSIIDQVDNYFNNVEVTTEI
jgi:hypothetical protein